MRARDVRTRADLESKVKCVVLMLKSSCAALLCSAPLKPCWPGFASTQMQATQEVGRRLPSAEGAGAGAGQRARGGQAVYYHRPHRTARRVQQTRVDASRTGQSLGCVNATETKCNAILAGTPSR